MKALLSADLGEVGAQISSEQLLGTKARTRVNKLLDDIKTYVYIQKYTSARI